MRHLDHLQYQLESTLLWLWPRVQVHCVMCALWPWCAIFCDPDVLYHLESPLLWPWCACALYASVTMVWITKLKHHIIVHSLGCCITFQSHNSLNRYLLILQPNIFGKYWTHHPNHHHNHCHQKSPNMRNKCAGLRSTSHSWDSKVGKYFKYSSKVFALTLKGPFKVFTYITNLSANI